MKFNIFNLTYNFLIILLLASSLIPIYFLHWTSWIIPIYLILCIVEVLEKRDSIKESIKKK